VPCYAADGVHPLVGEKPTDFTLRNLDGKEVSLSESKDKIILLHFFATFSKASLKQFPQMQKLHEEHSKRGLVVIGVTPEKNDDKVKKFARQNKLSYPILLDGWKVFKDYKLGQIPDVCIIDRKFAISAMYVGFNPCNEMRIEAEIKELLVTIPSGDY